MAEAPLWHDSQRPTTDGVTVAWSNLAPDHDAVDWWQVSHCAVVDTCVNGFVRALTDVNEPLWQVEQAPVVPV